MQLDMDTTEEKLTLQSVMKQKQFYFAQYSQNANSGTVAITFVLKSLETFPGQVYRCSKTA